ncbi:hypothetical protein [Clostridium sp.]|uniref:hypothetical protein n=1 Tax=Clostridium sp. TaxID=1506 RepID=UPI001E132538|nr:hypothetical protein [Clostridium sp.]MBS5939337.1 hypothetical protein [Clostridium sp.]
MKNSGKVLLGLALVIGGVAAAVVISKKVNEGEFDCLCKCCRGDEEEVVREEETITEE